MGRMISRRRNLLITVFIGSLFYLYLIYFSHVGEHIKKDLMRSKLISHNQLYPENEIPDHYDKLPEGKYENSAENAQISLDDSNLKPEDFCNGEPMVYTHISVKDSKKDLLKGHKFNCSTMEYLKKFHLTKEYRIKEKIKAKIPENIVFVIAADASYYPPSRAVIATIQKQFGSKNKILLYDLGGIKENQGYMNEIKGICNLELRTFDFNDLPPDVRGKKIFAWKVFIIAQGFMEYETFFYLDSSIYFENSDFGIFFDLMYNGSLTPFQMSGWTGHSIRHATNPGMYSYIPMDPTIPRRYWMMEANMMFFHRDEETRQIIKWSVLCSVTRDCIEPPGSSLGCPHETENSKLAQCHRQDQSVYNILLVNLEYKLNNFGKTRVILHMDKDHPKNTKQRHATHRGQQTNEKIDHCQKA